MNYGMTRSAIIADSRPLISLAIIDQLTILKQLYPRVVAPPAVCHEVTVKGKGMSGAEAVAQLSWLNIQKPEPQILIPLSIIADPGEAEAIALAQTIKDSIVLLDDSQARRIAERFDIPRIGTLGILRRAKIKGLIEEIKPMIDQLQANHIYMSDNLVKAVLDSVGE